MYLLVSPPSTAHLSEAEIDQAAWAAELRRLMTASEIRTRGDLEILAELVDGMLSQVRSALSGWVALASDEDRTALMMSDWLRGQERQLGNILTSTSEMLSDRWAHAWSQWWDAGVDSVVGPARSLGVLSSSLRVGRARLGLWLQYAPRLVREATEDTMSALGRILRRAMLTGDDQRSVQRQIIERLVGEPGRHASRFGGWAYQAERIYTTESQRLHEMGHAEAGRQWERQTGEVLVKVWRHQRQPSLLARDWHVAMDRQVRAIDEPFSNGLDHPKDPDGSARETINCRCYTMTLPARAAKQLGFSVPERLLRRAA
jgi:hypothetical protein